MEKRNLEVIKFNLFSKEDKDKSISMANMNGYDFLDILYDEFIPFLDKYPKDEKKKSIVKFFRDSEGKTFFKRNNNFRTLSGIIETGKYGKEENVVDIDNIDEGSIFKISKNHSVQKPFFFLICISKIKNEGLIILERQGVHGIKIIYSKILKDFLKSKYENYFFRFTNFIDKKVVENYIMKGDYNTIKLTQYFLPPDIADRYGLSSFESEDYIIELTLKTRNRKKIKGRSKKQIQKIFEENLSGFFESDELNDIGFDASSHIKVNSTYNKSSRTIDLSETMKFKPYYEINVEINDSGHSEFNSIQSEAVSLLKDFELELF